MSDNKYEVREGKFSLNKSTIKHEDGKSHPNWFGETIIKVDPEWKSGDLIKFKIAGWTSESKAGNKYISCTIKEKIENSTPETNKVDNSEDIL